MNKILFILFFSFTFGYSQLTDIQLLDIKWEYVETSDNHNIDGCFYLNKLDEISLELLRSKKLGDYDKITKKIRINILYINNKKLIRAVFFHEMGHVAGLKHLCKNCPYLMSEIVGIEFGEISDEDWQHQMDIYFTTIKMKHRNIITLTIE